MVSINPNLAELGDIIMDANKKRAVGYLRFARLDPGAELSEVSQKEEFQKFADRSGRVIVDWYVDRGCSGNSLDRDALQRLLDASQSDERLFEEVLVLSWSRLSRSVGHLLIVRSLLEAAGVNLVSVTEGDGSLIGDMVGGLMATIYGSHEAVQSEALGDS